MSDFWAFLQRRFKTLDDVGTTFAILGILLAGGASYRHLTRISDLGIASFGAAVIAWGANALQTREIQILQRGIPVWERVSEALARAWGIVFGAGGLALLGYGVLSAINPRSPIPIGIQLFFATQQGGGVQLLIGSCVGIHFALTMIFVSDTQGSNGFVRFLVSLPGRLLGVILLIVCGVLALNGALLIFAPDVWDTLVHFFWRTIGFE